MSQPRSARITAAEAIRMYAGPKVDIYVGPSAKHYHLPKDILCHHSKYFDRCFNGYFKEGEQQMLELPDDDPEWFEYLLEWMMCGGGHPIFWTTNSVENNQKEDDDVEDYSRFVECMRFVQYADKYELSGVAEIVVDDLVPFLLPTEEKMTNFNDIVKYWIPVIFRVFPEGHILRAQTAKYCWEQSSTTYFFEQEEREVHGFASEVLKQLKIKEFGLDEIAPKVGKKAKKRNRYW